LKGALGTLDAARAFRAAERLEHAARAGDLSDATGLVAALAKELTRLTQALGRFRRSPARTPPRRLARGRARRRR
jgi:HPt (histidine-containing phosphotransfer) domain-containing protein